MASIWICFSSHTSIVDILGVCQLEKKTIQDPSTLHSNSIAVHVMKRM
jgi:hypothetical protein